MSYLVVGKKSGDGWALDVQGVGATSAGELGDVETAVRALLASSGREDAADADLQLLLPDFEVDLGEDRLPATNRTSLALIGGIIALVVVVGALVWLIGRVF